MTSIPLSYIQTIQDEILEWQIFNPEIIDMVAFACGIIEIMNEKPDIDAYELGVKTMKLTMGHYALEKIFAFTKKDYTDFGKALLKARNEADEEEYSDEEEEE